jgi:hypothetical protein
VELGTWNLVGPAIDQRKVRRSMTKAVRNCAYCRKPIKSTDNDRVLMEYGEKEVAYYHTQCGQDETTRLILEDPNRWHVMLRVGDAPES